jgi:hypothetical protein
MPGGEPLLAVYGRVAWRTDRAAGIAFVSVGAEAASGTSPAARAEAVRRAVRRLLEEAEPA